jgi:phosphoglycolate phosphatase-like HAD superfamily hydrolase
MKHNRHPQAVVFDFDGTLVDSGEIKNTNYAAAFEHVFHTSPAQRVIILESCRRNAGANRFVQLEDTLGMLGRSATEQEKSAWSEKYSALGRAALSGIPEFPSVRGLLRKLRERGYALYAASGILEREFRTEMERRSLLEEFIRIHGGDKTGFLLSLKSSGIASILFVGDTEYDRRVAAEAGVDFFLVASDRDIRELNHMLVGERP